MKFEKSCGAIIVRKNNDVFETLLIKMVKGHWSFPKGHVENDETEVETALREIKEETNLDVIIDTRFREITTYSPCPGVLKDVIFFIAMAKTNDVVVQEAEVESAMWVELNEAIDIVTFECDRQILKKAIKYVEKQEV